MSRKHVPLAIAYDFDGTLAPGNMQEHQFLPDIGMTPKEFWSEVKALTKTHQADEVLIYMNLMLEKAHAKHAPVRREDFNACGKDIELFEGVGDWFERINQYGKEKDVRIEHYLLSSGNAEIFSGTSIASKFTKVYASKFFFDENGVAIWPALAVNYTTKTQYLFRINKGAHDLSDSAKVNEYVDKKNRPVPFESMIYIGDGATDIPCFRMLKEQGGLSIAVYTPKKRGARDKADKYLTEGRIHCVVPAIYNNGSDIDKVVKAYIDSVSARSALTGLFGEERK
jgi:2-hydroxy-3-keto-5-methylthiopentenyl-1-phosphate phosphatase